MEKEREQSKRREEEKEEEMIRLEPLLKSECERLNEELKNTQHTIQQMQVCIHTPAFSNDYAALIKREVVGERERERKCYLHSHM